MSNMNIQRRPPNQKETAGQPSRSKVFPTQRKVSLEHGSGVMKYDTGMQGPTACNDEYTMMNNMQSDPYGMPPSSDPYGMHNSSFMPMHPNEANMMGGSMMDQMMDFPSPNFFPPQVGSGGPPIQPRYMPMDEYGLQRRDSMRPNLAASTIGMGMPATMMPMEEPPKRKERAPSSTSFPTKLYKILADPKYQEHIAWLPHGRAWRVLKPKAFEEEVIPKFFRSDRYASFMRQVNGWGFKRVTEGPDLNAYYHEMFLRGLPQVAAKMRRPVKGQHTFNKDFGQCPDFYKISMFAPLPPPENLNDSKAGKKPKQTTSSKDTVGSVISQEDVMEVSLNDRSKKEDKAAKPQHQGHQQDGSKTPCPSPSQMQNEKLGNKTPVSTVNDDYMKAALDNTPSPLGMRTPRSSEYGFYGDVPPSAGANSVGSWRDVPDNELMWGGGHMSSTSSLSGISPSHSHMNSALEGEQFRSNAFGQVTPPAHSVDGSGRRKMSNNLRNSSTSDLMRMPLEDDTMGGASNGSGLSAADLYYLTHQNRILLSEAHKKK